MSAVATNDDVPHQSTSPAPGLASITGVMGSVVASFVSEIGASGFELLSVDGTMAMVTLATHPMPAPRVRSLLADELALSPMKPVARARHDEAGSAHEHESETDGVVIGIWSPTTDEASDAPMLLGVLRLMGVPSSAALDQQISTLQGRLAELMQGSRAAELEAALLDRIQEIVLVVDPEFRIRYLNNSGMRWLGWTATDVIGQPAFELVHPDDVEVLVREAGLLLRGESVPYRTQIRARAADGSWLPVELAARNRFDDPLVRGLVVSMRALMRNDEIEHRLVTDRRFLGSVMYGLEDGLIACDMNGVITLCNRAARAMFSIDPGAVARGFRDLPGRWRPAGSTDEHADGETPVSRTIAGFEFSGEEWELTVGEVVHYVRVRGRPVVNEHGERLGAVLALHETTRDRKTEERLRHEASHDTLTGLPNRASIERRLRQALDDPDTSSVAVVFIDVDGLKQVNDRFGHAAGDVLLREMASRFASTIRTGDLIGRWAGDEFVAICRGAADGEYVATLANRIRDAARRPVAIGDDEVEVSVSIGLALSPGDGSTLDELIHHADQAMYTLKRAGGDGWGRAGTTGASSGSGDETPLTVLRRALRDDELQIELQPIVAIGRALEAPMLFEAFARFRRSDGSVIAPSEWLPAAVRAGLMADLDHQVLEATCRAAAVAAARWPSSTVRFSCNVSAAELARPRFADRVHTALSDAGLAPSRLCLELTEASVMGLVDAKREELADLSARGVGLALDDFGTGHVPIAHLRDLPISLFKIDRSFVVDATRSARGRAMLRALAEMGRALDLGIVAKGIETESELEVAGAEGIDMVQGFLISPPLALPAFLEFLEQRVASVALPPTPVERVPSLG